MIGRELARRGIAVTVIVPRRQGQGEVEELDGMRVLGYRSTDMIGAYRLCKQADADIYHSQEPSLVTWLAMRAMPDRKHMITFRDTRLVSDWLVELRYPSANPLQVMANWFFEDSRLVRNSVRHANGLYTAAHMLIPKAKAKYNLTQDPLFLPTPVEMPGKVHKADVPTVCYVNRWDRRKRPELFFDLAAQFPRIQFIATGRSRDAAWEQKLRQKYKGVPNLHMMGFIDQFRSPAFGEILENSWVFVNTALREGLPNAFLEAAAYRCAILSAVDPDGFASRFGYHASHDEFKHGLEYLLGDDRFVQCGQRAREYADEVFSIQKSIDQHIEAYEHQL